MRPALPRLLAGQRALCDFLSTIGVETTPASIAQVTINRRMKLHTRNGRVLFRSKDTQKYVEHYTGYGFKDWVDRWEASDKKTPLVWRSPSRPKGVLRPLGVFAMLLDGHVMRRTDGFVYATSEKKDAKAWPVFVRERCDKVLEYRDSRMLHPEDLGSSAAPEMALVIPTVMRDGRLQDLTVPGELFGLKGVKTRLVAPLSWPKWRDLKGPVDRAYPDCSWVVWEKAIELNKYGVNEVAIPELRASTG